MQVNPVGPKALNQISVVSTYIYNFPLGLIFGICTILVCDWLAQQQHQLPEAAGPELGTKVPGADQEGGGDLNKVLHLLQQILQIKGTFLSHFCQRYVSSTVGNFRRKRDIAKYWFFKWENRILQNSKLQNLFEFSAFPAATVHGAVILLSWAPTCEDTLKKKT